MKYLNNLKTKHSKSDSFVCTEVEIAEYISTPRMDTKKKELLFKLRSRTLDVKQNFKNQQQNPWCISCGLFHETQGRLLQYSKGQIAKLNGNFIYDRIDQQIVIVHIYGDII